MRIHSVKDTFGPEFLIDLILWMYVCVTNSEKSKHNNLSFLLQKNLLKYYRCRGDFQPGTCTV